MFKYSLYACIIGFVLDFIIGDPNLSFHPIRLIGKLIEKSEAVLRKIFPDTQVGLEAAGLALTVIVCLTAAVTAGIIILGAYKINMAFGMCIEAVICCFMLAAKSLKTESMRVYKKLEENDLEGARGTVSMIVGRDTEDLDKTGIIKAAVETVAENLSDGVVAPIIYMLLGGGVLGVLYKAVNTMDSMVGYKNDRYKYFGLCAARLDDIVNFIPSRVSALMMILAAFILKKDYKNAVRIFKRDRLKHASPNSAQTESVCAGALRIKLAGDAYYFGKLYKKPYIGDALEKITIDKIKEANSLMYASAVLTIIISCGAKLAVILLWR